MVTAVFGKAGFCMVVSVVGGGTAVGGGCGCLGLISQLAPVQRLVWCLRLQLQHWFFNWHCELL